MKHKVSICVAGPNGERTQVLRGVERTFRSRFLKLMFGEKVGVIVMTPGETVETVEIKEIGGDNHGQR